MNEETASTQTAAERSATTAAASDVPPCPARSDKTLPTDRKGKRAPQRKDSPPSAAPGTSKGQSARRGRGRRQGHWPSPEEPSGTLSASRPGYGRCTVARRRTRHVMFI